MTRTRLDAFTKNFADLDPDETDAKLQPVKLSLTPGDAVNKVAEILRALPRWEVKSIDPAAATLHAIHITSFWRFRDDIKIRFEARGNGSIMFAHSQARLGKVDFGKNARNLRELTDAVRKRLAEPLPPT